MPTPAEKNMDDPAFASMYPVYENLVRALYQAENFLRMIPVSCILNDFFPIVYQS